MVEDFTPEATALLALSLVLFFVMVKSVYGYKTEARKLRRELDHEVNSVQQHLAHINAEITSLKTVGSKKVDASYLEQRIDGLINLISGKSSR